MGGNTHDQCSILWQATMTNVEGNTKSMAVYVALVMTNLPDTSMRNKHKSQGTAAAKVKRCHLPG